MRYRPKGLYRAKCPYYITDSRYTITCTGCDFARRHRLLFDTEMQKNRHLDRYCCIMPGDNGCDWQRFVGEQEEKQ